MMQTQYLKGSDLSSEDQAKALLCFYGRSTIKNPGYGSKPQFKDDQDWLENTIFHVTKQNRLDRRFYTCESTPTWPKGKPGVNG